MKTFEEINLSYNWPLQGALNALTSARTLDEADEAATQLKALTKKYTAEIKHCIRDCDLRIAEDHSMIQRILNDRLNLDPEKAQVTSEKGRNTVRWTITLFGKEKYFYVSKVDKGVDEGRFIEWCLDILG